MGVEAKKVENQPSYFLTTQNLKGTWIANIVYKTAIELESLKNFVPSEECLELKFFSKEEAEKEKLFPNVKEFIKLFDLENY